MTTSIVIFCVQEEQEQEEAKTMTIIDHHHLLSFKGTMKANTKKRNKDYGCVLSSSCLRGAKAGGGGKDNNN
jgi:inorganic pyrophosphatase/exopolyphosphatase